MNLQDHLRNLNMQPPEGVVTPEPTGFACNRCDDMGYVRHAVPYGHPDFGKAFPCPNPDCPTANKIRKDSLEKRFGKLGIPEKFADSTFAKWDAFMKTLPVEISRGKIGGRAVCGAFVKHHGKPFSLASINKGWASFTQERRGFVLRGDYGAGKTTLLCATAHELVAMGIPVLYFSAQQMFRTLTRAIDTETTDEVLDAIFQVPVLAIDDCNLNRTEWQQEKLTQIIDWRYANSLPIIMTMNATKDEFEDVWGSRAASRLWDLCHVIKVAEPIRDETSPDDVILEEADNE